MSNNLFLFCFNSMNELVEFKVFFASNECDINMDEYRERYETAFLLRGGELGQIALMSHIEKNYLPAGERLIVVDSENVQESLRQITERAGADIQKSKRALVLIGQAAISETVSSMKDFGERAKELSERLSKSSEHIITMSPVTTVPFITRNDNKPFYHNISNKRKKKKK